MKKAYLGDGLYAEFDGTVLKLYVNYPDTDRVYLYPEVWQELKKFMENDNYLDEEDEK